MSDSRELVDKRPVSDDVMLVPQAIDFHRARSAARINQSEGNVESSHQVSVCCTNDCNLESEDVIAWSKCRVGKVICLVCCHTQSSIKGRIARAAQLFEPEVAVRAAWVLHSLTSHLNGAVRDAVASRARAPLPPHLVRIVDELHLSATVSVSEAILLRCWNEVHRARVVARAHVVHLESLHHLLPTTAGRVSGCRSCSDGDTLPLPNDAQIRRLNLNGASADLSDWLLTAIERTDLNSLLVPTNRWSDGKEVRGRDSLHIVTHSVLDVAKP